MDWQSQLPVLGQVALAMLLGGLLGIERERAGKPAGFRTHMLIAATAALLVGLSDALVERFQNEPEWNLSPDPIRIVQAIVVGIGFLGAGTIIQGGGAKRVEGLTTGASLLLAAAIGIAVAANQYILAAGSTLLALLVLGALATVERKFSRKKHGQDG